jgi:hypothetical protein
MPTIDCQFTCEAEYCIASLAVMAGSYLKKFINEISGHYSDRLLTIPVGTDSQSEIDTANSPKETSHTRHIALRSVLQMVQLYCSIFKEPTTLLTASPSPLQHQHYNLKPMFFKWKWTHDLTSYSSRRKEE